MRQPFLGLMVVVALMAGGCAASSRHAATTPSIGFYTHFEEETAELMRTLPCEWTHAEAVPLEGHTYDFGCHGGRWGSVSLLVDAADHAPEYIERVRLIWRSWPYEDPRISDADVANYFVREVTSRFVAPQMAGEIEQTFMQGKAKAWRSEVAELTVKSYPNAQENVHRLEIKLKDTL